MVTESYSMWTEKVSNGEDDKALKKTFDNPLRHLKKNYLNPKSPIAFSGITNIYNYYGGQLGYKEISDYLKTVDSYTLHKKSRMMQHNPSFSRYHRHQIQIDLVDIRNLARANKGFNYLLTAIDSFTRRGFCVTLKDKKQPLF